MTRSYLLIVALSIFAALPVNLRAQTDQAIHGAVVAKADHSSVPGARVVLQGNTLPQALETATEPDGHFGFPRLVPGDYLLTISHDRFQQESLGRGARNPGGVPAGERLGGAQGGHGPGLGGGQEVEYQYWGGGSATNHPRNQANAPTVGALQKNAGVS